MGFRGACVPLDRIFAFWRRIGIFSCVCPEIEYTAISHSVVFSILKVGPSVGASELGIPI